jgi:hypothetical protein
MLAMLRIHAPLIVNAAALPVLNSAVLIYITCSKQMKFKD